MALTVLAWVGWRNSESDCLSAGDSMAAADYPPETDVEAAQTDDGLWFDTIMFTGRHALRYCGDVSDWGGWYYDSIFVGDDMMLQYDSAGPTSVKLNLVTRQMVVNLDESDAARRISRFLGPVSGFRRFDKECSELLDSVFDEEYGPLTCQGRFVLTIDYVDPDYDDAALIDNFMLQLAGVGYNDHVTDPDGLARLLSRWMFDTWKSDGDTDGPGNEARLDLRAHVANGRYVTYSCYEYEAVGLGHGMYTETFHTLDLATGVELANEDLFVPGSLDKVKRALYETMAADPHYLQWNPGTKASDISYSLPAGALTRTGVVFSYQPYQIDCWAAGAFHFTVPYARLRPYLTDRAKEIIG